MLRQRRPVLLGLLLGAGFGAWNLIVTRRNPVADDTPAALLMFYGPMFAMWSIAAFATSRRTGRFWDGVRTGTAVAFVTFLVFDLTVILRVNLFLDALTGRPDWQNLMATYRTSGFESLRTFVNYHYVTQAPVKILVASAIGAIVSAIGGSLGSLTVRRVSA